MIPSTQIRQVLFLLLIAVLFGLIFWNLLFFMPAFLGAYTLYVLLRRPVFYLSETRKWNQKGAVALMMLLAFVVIFLPISGLVQMMSVKVIDGSQHSEQLLANIQTSLQTLEKRIGSDFHLLTPDRIKTASEWGVGQARSILGATLRVFLMLIVTFFILFFMLMGGKKMELSFFSWLPLRPENCDFLRKELNDLIYSNAIGIPLMGVVQGLAGLIGYSLAGVEDVWFWVFLTFIAGMIPFVGVALAFFPLALVLFSKGETSAATFILIYGFVVIGSVDNLARMWLLKKIGHTHPLVTLFGVVIGLQLFGFVGFIFGPILISMFFLLMQTYQKEFR